MSRTFAILLAFLSITPWLAFSASLPEIIQADQHLSTRALGKLNAQCGRRNQAACGRGLFCNSNVHLVYEIRFSPFWLNIRIPEIISLVSELRKSDYRGWFVAGVHAGGSLSRMGKAVSSTI